MPKAQTSDSAEWKSSSRSSGAQNCAVPLVADDNGAIALPQFDIRALPKSHMSAFPVAEMTTLCLTHKSQCHDELGMLAWTCRFYIRMNNSLIVYVG